MEKTIIYLVTIKILATILYSVGDLTTNKKLYFMGYFDGRQNIIFGQAQNQ